MLGPILVRIGHDHASRSPGYPWALLRAVVDLQAVVNVADLHERRSCRVSAAPDRVLGAERPANFGSADPQSQQVPLARWVLGVVDECRSGVQRHEVVEKLQVAHLELHAKSNAWSLR